VDHLENSAEAVAWLAERGLVSHGTTISETELSDLLELRTAVRALFVARIDSCAPREQVVATINRATRAAPSICSLSWTEADPPTATMRHVRGTVMARALAEIAIDAIDTVCGERAKRLLECEAPGCVRLLEREHARQRWCSTACGDRVRAARYYSRHRSDPAL